MLVSTVFLPIFTRQEPVVAPAESENPTGNDDLGYELLDSGAVFHMWNTYNDYYFNRSNGVQFTNHYQEYWTRNVLMLGYYNNDQWHLLYRVDELSGFTEILDYAADDYINATLWKDLSYGSYDFRVAIRYSLAVDDRDLTIVPYIKNLGIAIPFDIGFGWEMKDINIANVTNDNYLWIGNNTITEKILLNQTLDKSWNDLESNTKINLVCTNPPSPYLSRNLYLMWDKNLNYKVTCKSRTNQNNAPVTLFIKVGTLAVGQEKSTEMHWLDADAWLGISSTNLEDFCGEENSALSLVNALDGVLTWQHNVAEVHWFVLDLGETYIIKKVRGRTKTYRDPIDVNIYIDDNNPPTTLCEEGITTWQDRTTWDENTLTTPGTGRYIKVEIEGTEYGSPGEIHFGGEYQAWFAIFDAYGDVAAPANTAPTQSAQKIWNSTTKVEKTLNATAVDLQPTCFNVTIADIDSDQMNVTILTNESGAWTVVNQTASGMTDGTFHGYNTSWVDSYDTKYWISFNVSDDSEWCNETFNFTTVTANNAPTVDYKTPVNGTTGVSFSGGVTCYAYTNDTDGDNLDITWATNESGSWVNKYTNTSEAANGTESYTFTVFDTGSTIYWWKVYVDDGTVNISEIYHFTTGSFIWIDITNTSWDIGNIIMSSSTWTNETSKTFIADKDNCTVATDLKLQITNDGVDWTAATAGNDPAADTYRLNVSIDVWGADDDQVVTASAGTISTNIVAGNNETFDLRFDAPSSTSVSAQQSITVTATVAKT